MGSIPGFERSPGGGHGNPLQHSYLENPVDSGAWQAIVHGVVKSRTQLKFWQAHRTSIKALSSNILTLGVENFVYEFW